MAAGLWVAYGLLIHRPNGLMRAALSKKELDALNRRHLKFNEAEQPPSFASCGRGRIGLLACLLEIGHLRGAARLTALPNRGHRSRRFRRRAVMNESFGAAAHQPQPATRMLVRFVIRSTFRSRIRTRQTH